MQLGHHPGRTALAPVKGSYDDGDGQTLPAVGAVRFAAAPPEGGTVPGGYVVDVHSPDGGAAAPISGPFCALFVGEGSW